MVDLIGLRSPLLVAEKPTFEAIMFAKFDVVSRRVIPSPAYAVPARLSRAGPLLD